MRVFFALLAVCLMCGACVVGPRPSLPVLERSPGGVQLQIVTTGGPVYGELLWVQGEELLIRTLPPDPVRIVRIPFAAIRTARGPARLGYSGGRPDSRQRVRLIRMSRYPHAVWPELEAEVLREYGLSSVEEVEEL